MELSHIDEKGNARMVNVEEKQITKRLAEAEGKVFMKKETLAAITQGNTPKGEVLNTARIAGILAAKNTDKLIPMCHSLPINGIDLAFEIMENCIRISSSVFVEARTGVEMEALTAVSVAALTVYDMVKAIDKEMEIGEIHLLRKLGGRSGEYRRTI